MGENHKKALAQPAPPEEEQAATGWEVSDPAAKQTDEKEQRERMINAGVSKGRDERDLPGFSPGSRIR